MLEFDLYVRCGEELALSYTVQLKPDLYNESPKSRMQISKTRQNTRPIPVLKRYEVPLLLLYRRVKPGPQKKTRKT
jgi:hypothetical protein